MAENFIRGSARLRRLLAEPETRAEVNTIRVEMQQSDRAHAMAVAGIQPAANLTDVDAGRHISQVLPNAD